MTRAPKIGRPPTRLANAFTGIKAPRNKEFAAWEAFVGIATIEMGRLALGVDYKTYKNYQLAKELPRITRLAMQAIALDLKPWGEE